MLKNATPEELVRAVRIVAAGEALLAPSITRRVIEDYAQRSGPARNDDRIDQLTDRELEVLRLLADGHSYKTAADALDVSLDTLRSHVRNIYEKLHVHSKSEAVLKAFKTGLLL